MYDAVADDYCYPGTTVLKNKLNLTDSEELAAFEAIVRPGPMKNCPPALLAPADRSPQKCAER
jgi:hypothetical protein